jgi:predicted O-methyltransferase YrrM
MSNRTLPLDDRLYRYLLDHSVRETPEAAALRAATRNVPGSGMQISPDQAQLMTFLVQVIGVQRALEIGTYTGYSALAVALALPPTGKLVCCDVSEEWTAIARRFWERAGVAHKIDLRLAPALDTLDRLLAGGGANTFDFAFIDADKTNYDAYYERCLLLVRAAGVIAIDNVLWGGSVADPTDTSQDTQALRALNAKLHRDERVTLAMVPIGDGLTLALKR